MKTEPNKLDTAMQQLADELLSACFEHAQSELAKLEARDNDIAVSLGMFTSEVRAIRLTFPLDRLLCVGMARAMVE